MFLLVSTQGAYDNVDLGTEDHIKDHEGKELSQHSCQ